MHTLIIGDGAAGVSAARALRERDADIQITIISADPHPAYYRAALTNYLLGELAPHQLQAIPVDFFHRLNIERVHGALVSLDPRKRSVSCEAQGEEFELSYDYLVLATGSRAALPAYPPEIARWIRVLRTLRDATSLEEELTRDEVRRALIIGGGPLALEWAAAYHQRGVQVSLVVRSHDSLMRHELNQRGRDLVYAHLRAHIQVYTGELTQIYTRSTPAGERLSGVALSGGVRLEVDLIGAAVGVKPNIEPLEGSGLKVTPRGVCVDRHLRAEDPHIFAGGDLAVVDGESPLGLWEPAQRHGALIAEVIHALTRGAPLPSPLPLTPHYFATRLFHLDFVMFQRAALDAHVLSSSEQIEQLIDVEGVLGYRALRVSGAGELLSVHLLGEPRYPIRRQGRALYHVLRHQLNVTAIMHHLRGDRFDLWGWARRQLPDADEAPSRSAHALLDYRLPEPAESAPLRLTLRDPQGGSFEVLGGQTPLAKALAPHPQVAPAALGGVSIVWDGRRYRLEVGERPHQLALNGKALRKSAPLRDGDRLEVGPALIWTLSLTQAPRKAASSSPALPSQGSAHAEVTQEALPARTSPLFEYALEVDQATSPIHPGVYVLGRAPQCEIVLSDSGVSAIHGELTYQLSPQRQAEIFYRDLGSTNGSLLDGSRINAPVLLRPEQVLTLGAHQITLMRRRARLEVNLEHGEQRATFHLSDGDVIVIGRDPKSVHWSVNDLGVSGAHCELKVRERRLWARDLGSRNGTALNAKPIAEAFVEWPEGSPLHLGKTCVITWRSHGDKEAPHERHSS